MTPGRADIQPEPGKSLIEAAEFVGRGPYAAVPCRYSANGTSKVVLPTVKLGPPILTEVRATPDLRSVSPSARTER